MLHPSLFHENFCDKHVIDQMQYWDYLPNMLCWSRMALYLIDLGKA